MRQPASLLQGLEQAWILAVLHAPSPRQAGTDHDRWA